MLGVNEELNSEKRCSSRSDIQATIMGITRVIINEYACERHGEYMNDTYELRINVV